MTNKLYVGSVAIQDYSKAGESNLTYNHVKNQQRIINTCKLYNNQSQHQQASHNNDQKPSTLQDNNCSRDSPVIFNNNNNNSIQKKPSTNNTIDTKKNTIQNFDITSNDTDKLIGKRKLEFPNYDYITFTHSEKLYIEFQKLLVEFDDIFAKHKYHRRDLNVPPIKLGLRPEAYQHSIKRQQPTLSPAKTKAAIAIAQEHIKSGFLKPNTTSIHRVPYGMLVKIGADGTPDPFNKFYDFRKLNEYVDVRGANIPTKTPKTDISAHLCIIKQKLSYVSYTVTNVVLLKGPFVKCQSRYFYLKQCFCINSVKKIDIRNRCATPKFNVLLDLVHRLFSLKELSFKAVQCIFTPKHKHKSLKTQLSIYIF